MFLMKKMKKKIALLLAVITLISINTVAFAEESTAAEEPDASSINQIYNDIFTTCSNAEYYNIEDDYDVYSYLLQNEAFVVTTSPLTLSSAAFENLNESETDVINGFVSKINTLIELNAISVDDDLEFTMPDAPSIQNTPSPNAIVINIMPETREHANELRSVYDNAIFGTATITAGVYFYQRVRSGGIWDYKTFMGLTDRYYDSELQANMTGETIGNFHYGYVGSAVFGPTVLKSAAGFAQIVDGNSNLSYMNSYFDDPRDQRDIQWGIDKYNEEQ